MATRDTSGNGHEDGRAAARAAARRHDAHGGEEDHGRQDEHGGQDEHKGQDDHGGHDKHAGHSPAMFRERLWVSLALTAPILAFSPQLQAWFGFALPAFPADVWVAPVLATVLFFYGGAPFLRGARHELADRRPAMMALIALAISVAYVFSMAVSLGFPGRPFFWELATLIDVMLLGHWIEMSSIQGASRALDELTELVPNVAHRLADGDRTEDVEVATLSEGDRILIRPGEQVPADGEVEDGRSSVNEAFLTGESRPVAKEPGSEVVAGAVNSDGALTVRVTRVGGDTAIRQVMRLVDEAQASRSQFQGLADRAAGWLAYVALGAGILTLVTWLLLGKDVTSAIALMVTVLVIACPHALGLAIPLVTVNATSMAAHHGILVRNREAFERARDLRFVAFDKTGTLTEGRFEVSEMRADDIDEDRAWALALGLEGRSEHPLAAAIREAGEGREAAAVQDFEVEAGSGVSGTFDGARYRIGRPEWAEELDLPIPESLAERLRAAEERGESVVLLMDERGVRALFALGDRVRPSAKRAVAALQQRGVTVVMVTGDAEAVARTVAEELGIERTYARVRPEEKADRIRALQGEGATAFVGDGINDAPALLRADLGVAIGAGTNVAIESADLVLVENDPLDVVRVLTLSRATYGKMVQNLVWATGYNVVAIPLAAGVLAPVGILLSPAVGALLMSVSTIIVAVNAMLLRRVSLA